MSVQITWLPNPEADIVSYELQRSDDAVVFTLLTTIVHNLLDGAVYNAAIGRFYYDDPTGIAGTHYYRLRALDSASNQSGYTTAKQAGPPTPPLCVVFGTIVCADGKPNTDVQVTARMVSTKDTKDGQIVSEFGVTAEQIEAFTDDAGFFEIPLLQGADVILEIPKIELRREICIPALASVNFQALL